MSPNPEASSSWIVLPPRLDGLLARGDLAHAVRQAAHDFGTWFGDPATALYFFPEYTDHGPGHVSSVLAGTDWLTHEDAWPLLAPEDAIVLILAAILHDSAMHLTADGLLSLLASPRPDRWPAWELLDRQSWAELFALYLAEARRWDQRQLHRILGDERVRPEEQPDLVTFIRHPREQPDSDTWSTTYRKFLGEFVRRHHPRLAHEIALDGVPGSVSPALRIANLPSDLLDLAGLVARSHGRPLRDFFGYLRLRYHGRVTCRNAHPLFLAALLRIADYLEMRPDRVHPLRRHLQRLRSPISRDEWNAHLAVREIRHPDEEDAEAVFVVASPESAGQFVKLRRLLLGLQLELDTSWAVLGEVFSRQGPLAHLALTLRRVRSNLDDPEQFFDRERPGFFPLPAAFTMAGADLLKLLIRPLYGDRPEVGVRELLQNAVDAVRELWQHAADRGDPERREIPLAPQQADVLIAIDTDAAGQRWLTVTDRGIGMTAATVRDYFLKAGASLRTSDAWRREFEVAGHSKILRAGRFGIGALAAFLLGPRLAVGTRHVSEPAERGIHFTASLEDDSIDLLRLHREVVGTTIRIALASDPRLDSDREGAAWDWFMLDVPRVERQVEGRALAQSHHLPVRGSPFLPDGWTTLPFQAMEIHWRWELDQSPFVACNGIWVNDDEGFAKTGEDDLRFNTPSISVHDPDGILPLNLRRDRLEWPIPFHDQLLADLTRDLLAFLLVHAPQRPAQRRYEIPSLTEPLWTHAEGTSLVCLWSIERSGLRRALCVDGAPNFLSPLPQDAGVFFESQGAWRHQSIVPRLEKIGSYERVLARDSRRDSPALKSLQLAKVARGWHLYTAETSGDGLGLLAELYDRIMNGEETGIGAAYELRIDPGQAAIPASPITALMDDLMPSPIIPFDPALRRQRFARAFDQLRDGIELWQRPDLEGWRKAFVERLQA